MKNGIITKTNGKIRILKDLQKKEYHTIWISDDSDKRNKLICLTESGMEYTKDIIEKLHSKEIYVIEKIGIREYRKS